MGSLTGGILTRGMEKTFMGVMRDKVDFNKVDLQTMGNTFKFTPCSIPQQRADLYEQPGLVPAPFRAVPAELLDDGRQRLVLLHSEVRDALGRRLGHQDVLVQHFVNPLPRHRLVPAPIG